MMRQRRHNGDHRVGNYQPCCSESNRQSLYHRFSPQEIMTLRGNCPLSSRNVFFLVNSAAAGCTAPFASVARETRVCSPGVAPSQRQVKSFHEYRVFDGSSVAFCQGPLSICTSTDFKGRSEEHTSELQSQFHLVCRLLL